MSARPLRIAILCHSVNPRGGVVHALELASALGELGHEPVAHAPDPSGRGFFRKTAFGAVSVLAKPVGADVAEMVATRVDDYLAHFADPAARRFDVFHAQDGISGNALATLKERGLIRRFVRTVHHLDAFSDLRVEALQRRSVVASDARMVVSDLWRDELAVRFGLDSTLAPNGVDTARYRPCPDGREAKLRDRFGLDGAPIVLAIGGVEQRKNTRGLLDAFRQLRRIHERAQLVIAGGASVLDHGAYRAEFDRDLAASGLPSGAVVETGPLADADMPALYRVASVLAFPSVREGFGLVVLEAMASGLPAVVSRIAPFTEHLGDGDVAWCNPLNPASIADAMMIAISEPLRTRFADRGVEIAARRGWRACAEAHLAVYERLKEQAYA